MWTTRLLLVGSLVYLKPGQPHCGVILLPCDLTAGLAGCRQNSIISLTIESADEFAKALLCWATE